MQFRLAPSATFACLIVVAHFGAAAALLAIASETALGWALAVLIAALGIATAWDRALLRGPGSVRGFAVDGAEGLVLELASKEQLRSRVGARRWVSAWFVIVPIAAPRRRTLLVAGGMLDAEAFRRLRLWALWGQLPGVAATQRDPVSTQMPCA